MSHSKTSTLKGEQDEVDVRVRHAVGKVKHFAFGTDVSSLRRITDVVVIAFKKFQRVNSKFIVTVVIFQHQGSLILSSRPVVLFCQNQCHFRAQNKTRELSKRKQ